jgi:hypothetical protein
VLTVSREAVDMIAAASRRCGKLACYMAFGAVTPLAVPLYQAP